MYLIVVGGGRVSKQLIKLAKENKHSVAVIEKQKDRARSIMAEFDVRVFCADIAQGKILEEAEVNRADAIIATTKDDSVNLMAMVLGKQHQVSTLVAMLQEAEHKPMFEKLGVKVLAHPERIVAQQLMDFVA